jgi:hypothetical protein
MSGFVMALGTCFGCNRVFGFNPNKVPSIRIDGVKEPVCGDCMELANVERKALGLPPHEIQPDAYEPLPEGSLFVFSPNKVSEGEL